MAEDRFTILYKTYGPSIYAKCRRMLRDPTSAEEATQEIFLRVATHLDNAPTSVEALTWIYRIATNYCLNVIRDEKRRARPANAPLPRVGDGDVQGSAANRDLVRRLIERSPEHLRASAWLYHVDGMSHEEVGQTLGCSRRTVINRVAEFHKRARKFLEGEP